MVSALVHHNLGSLLDYPEAGVLSFLIPISALRKVKKNIFKKCCDENFEDILLKVGRVKTV